MTYHRSRLLVTLVALVLAIAGISVTSSGAFAYDKPQPKTTTVAATVNLTQQTNVATYSKGSVSQLNANQTTQNVAALAKSTSFSGYHQTMATAVNKTDQTNAAVYNSGHVNQTNLNGTQQTATAFTGTKGSPSHGTPTSSTALAVNLTSQTNVAEDNHGRVNQLNANQTDQQVLALTSRQHGRSNGSADSLALALNQTGQVNEAAGNKGHIDQVNLNETVQNVSARGIFFQFQPPIWNGGTKMICPPPSSHMMFACIIQPSGHPRDKGGNQCVAISANQTNQVNNARGNRGHVSQGNANETTQNVSACDTFITYNFTNNTVTYVVSYVVQQPIIHYVASYATQTMMAYVAPEAGDEYGGKGSYSMTGFGPGLQTISQVKDSGTNFGLLLLGLPLLLIVAGLLATRRRQTTTP